MINNKEMIFEWQWTDEEVKVIQKLDRIKDSYARKVLTLMKNLPTSQHRLIFYEACDTSFPIYWEVSQMDNEFRTRQK